MEVEDVLVASSVVAWATSFRNEKGSDGKSVEAHNDEQGESKGMPRASKLGQVTA